MMDSRRWAIERYEQSVNRIASRHAGGIDELTSQHLSMTLSPAAAMDYARIQGLQRAAAVMADAIRAEQDQPVVTAA